MIHNRRSDFENNLKTHKRVNDTYILGLEKINQVIGKRFVLHLLPAFKAACNVLVVWRQYYSTVLNNSSSCKAMCSLKSQMVVNHTIKSSYPMFWTFQGSTVFATKTIQKPVQYRLFSTCSQCFPKLVFLFFWLIPLQKQWRIQNCFLKKCICKC